ncbi:MAG: helix-turn-helix domain-containing protein [Deltaproteobacteria bacterium]|nr:helix-turn-helix domain-containing protein [Deltaproteobacteria bacterium]
MKLYEDLAADGLRIPDLVKSLRKMLAKDQPGFAKQVGISLATLRKIEQDRGNVTMDSVRKILDRYDLDLVVTVRKKS